ncbi:PREDICTED: alpha-S1-casein [Chinchilla lanigera]|uniref:alpha-S1-casein n=1 Tax=Chinchilla lanigera TaxID=34839 RepID=UPI0006977BF5|nr:PREDICTED: alpha-S1-casein [Chinchilla lanigera]
MKLLILACLLVAAAAMPKFAFRHMELSQNQQDSSSSSEEILKDDKISKFIQPTSVEFRKQTEHQSERQNEEIKETSSESTEQIKSTSSSPSEKCNPREDMVYQLNLEQLLRLIKYNQHQLEAAHAQEKLYRKNEHNQAQMRGPMRMANQEQAQFFYELNAYPFTDWYYPPQVQYVPFLPFFNNMNPIIPENIPNTDVMSEWLN